MKKVWKDTAVGAVGGGVGGAAGGLLARGANTARLATSRGSTSSTAPRVCNALGKITVRSTVAAGVGGASSNIASYAWDDEVDHTFGGYAATAGTGFLVGAGGSLAIGKVGATFSDDVAMRFPRWTGPISNREHVGPPLNWGSFLTEQGVDRLGGGLFGAANTALQPGDAKDEDLWISGVQGFAMGGSGPVSGRHSSGW